jgi:hypothetical protein
MNDAAKRVVNAEKIAIAKMSDVVVANENGNHWMMKMEQWVEQI